MEKKGSTGFLHSLWHACKSKEKRGRGIANTMGYRGVNAKVSVALLTKFSKDHQKQTNYDCLIYSFQ